MARELAAGAETEDPREEQTSEEVFDPELIVAPGQGRDGVDPRRETSPG